MGSNPILKKIMYYIHVECKSPVSVASGREDKTDGDILLDYDGKPFIAGSSLAGALRGYLQLEEDEENIFGSPEENNADGKDKDDDDSKKKQGRMSSVFVSDLQFTNKVKIVTRDGVGLSDGKTAITGAKFDMEAIDTGAEGYFILEMVVRANDPESKMRRQLDQALYGLQTGEIRLGNKKTRGYGEMQITAIRTKEYTAENIREYIHAYDINRAAAELNSDLSNFKERCRLEMGGQNRYVRMEVPLKLTGGISIRQYAAKKNEPDFVHITADGKAVIPGTSFAGAVRSRMKALLQDMIPSTNKKAIDYMMEYAWGYVNKESAHQSHIVIGESVIDGNISMTMARTSISRFEASAGKGSLFKERVCVGGTLTLCIDISRNIAESWVVGLLLLVVKDLQNGYLAVGGQTAIGRGIFEANGEITIDGQTVIEHMYFQKFQTRIEEAVV